MGVARRIIGEISERRIKGGLFPEGISVRVSLAVQVVRMQNTSAQVHTLMQFQE